MLPVLNAEKITLKWYGDSQPLFSIKSVDIYPNQKIGLIGSNGTGKSTLLKLLARIPIPGAFLDTNYSVTKTQTWYVPQIEYLEDSELTVYDYLSTKVDNWWEPLDILEKEYGLEDVSQRRVESLSGGEKMKLNLAIALTSNSAVLLMDEPSNHLDRKTRKKLFDQIVKIDKAVVISSHDIELLTKVCNRIWELNDKTITEYGGNYEFFAKEKETQLNAKERRYVAAKKEFAKTKRNFQKVIDQSEKNQTKAMEKKKNHNSGIARIQMGYFQQKSEHTVKKTMKSMASKLERVGNVMEKNAYIPQKQAFLDISSADKAKRLLMRLIDCKLSIKNELLVDNINLDIYYGDRISIMGDNGTGKSSLVKGISGILENEVTLDGEIEKIESLKVVYIDQTYSIVDVNKSLLENVTAVSNLASSEEQRKALGNMLFRDEKTLIRSAKTLSGGEISRLAFAMISIQSDIDILVLDEPTNNLDIDTIQVITSAINSYEGALIVISHDEHFLKSINCTRTVSIENMQFLS